ncbi:Laccase-2 [Camellia lanceoleosa]|uniref:Laccase-2 n=1 Tax=Camellia lanceoleosa TaxID=1840588 RepID=A0ACC0FRD5_9ERIC|nr:Laccase-2 [Camellia lanceoleosa]
MVRWPRVHHTVSHQTRNKLHIQGHIFRRGRNSLVACPRMDNGGVHGAIVILPVEGTTYPFPEPDEEQIIVLGWFLGMRTLPLSVSKPWKRTKLRRQSFNFGVNIGLSWPC